MSIRYDETNDAFKKTGTRNVCTPAINSLLSTDSLRDNVAGKSNKELLTLIKRDTASAIASRCDVTSVPKIKKAGYERTMRFSPGYGAWPLQAQEILLPLCEADKIGIKLTDTDIMIPRKSVSAVIGWRRADGAKGQ